MTALSAIVDRELEACGFSKAAAAPPPPVKSVGRTVGSPPAIKQAAGVGLPDSPAKIARAMADAIPATKLLQQFVEKQASAACGLRNRTEALQVFTGSDVINKIKLAGLREMAMKVLPDDWLLPLVRRMKGTSMFPTQYADDVEAMLVGRGLRNAAQTKDVNAARTLFEGLGGTPTIDPSELAGLQLKAKALDAYIKDPMERYMSGMQTGGLGGALAGVGGTLGVQQLLESNRR